MKQNTLLRIAVLLSLIIIVIIGGCTQKTEILDDSSSQSEEISEETSQETSEKETAELGFDIYYSFGVGEKNIIDTKNDLYIKDMICDGLVEEYDFQLTEAEKMSIYNSVLENDLFTIKDEFTENCDLEGKCLAVTPLSTTTLKITLDGKTKIIKWSGDYIDEDDPELEKFQNVEKVIQNIIFQKEKEMNIEQPQCGYL